MLVDLRYEAAEQVNKEKTITCSKRSNLLEYKALYGDTSTKDAKHRLDEEKKYTTLFEPIGER